MDSRSQEDPSKELERLAEEQVNDLEMEVQERLRNAKQRCDRVAALYTAGAVQSPEEHYHAALVMLYGDEMRHFDLARQLAKIAAQDDEERAWSVLAAAWDRALIARNQPQRFGTQFVRENGHWSLGDVNERTTDAERAFYGVPPLWFQRQNLEQIRRREDTTGD
jgi:hypothetical protein